MSTCAPLLKTKLYTPPRRPELVPRPRLIERLDAGLYGGRKLTLISAPAGFGKTTLVVEWLQQTDRPFGWLSLDEGDNDPARFFTYLLAALQRIAPRVGGAARAMLEAPQPPAPEPLLTSLVNDLSEILHPLILVLDDYHVIEALTIQEAVSFLLDRAPPSVHLVIVTRADPPLPIARLRVRGQLSELHAADLRFTPAEIGVFLNDVMGLALAPEQVAALDRRTEGWIAGLQLAALSLQGRDDVSDFIQAFTGSQRYVLDYLTEEVLNRQPPEVQAFLLQTAILDRLSGPLCDAVLDAGPAARDATQTSVAGRRASGSQAVLEALEGANLFLTPLDEERRWYRYHALFASLLRHQLQRERGERVPELHRRASVWYEENGMMPAAVNHALASGDLERAAGLVEWTAWQVLTRGELTTVLGWLDALPRDLARSRPQLGILHAWALAFTGQWAGVESRLPQVEDEQVQGDVAAVRAYVAGVQGDVADTIRFAQRALALMPEEKWFSRGIVALSLGIAYQSSGELVAAIRALTEAVTFSRAAGRTYLTMVSTATLGHAQEMQGLLHRAAETHREALRLASEEAGRPVPFAGIAHVGIAELLYEWNDLEGALRHALEGIRLSELGGFVSYALAGRALLARVYQARGDVEGALDILRQAQWSTQGHAYDYVAAVIVELRARLWVQRGELAAASRWAAERRVSGRDGVNSAQEVEQMGVARVRLAQGKPGEALALLARLLEAADAAARVGSAIKLRVRQALAFQAQGAVDRALSALERALSLAEPEAYVRTFVDEGEPMARLLRQALSQGIHPSYVARLLALHAETAAPASPAVPALVEALSARELEVLRLIVAGLSNQEIAQELVVAVSTVKSHINHIYGKLGVKSRTQAVARARALDLL